MAEEDRQAGYPGSLHRDGCANADQHRGIASKQTGRKNKNAAFPKEGGVLFDRDT
jgi:hypothetical protein